jgi:uncharacterized surface protein with fasciclin (FAS1) repeats
VYKNPQIDWPYFYHVGKGNSAGFNKENVMLKHLSLSALAASLLIGGAALAPVNAIDAMQKSVTVGGAAMLPTKNIIQNASASKDHTTLVTLVKAAGLDGTLQGPGPFTVFAPTNAAFTKLGSSTLTNLQKPESKDMLKQILSYHVISGKYTAEDLSKIAKDNGGLAKLKTAEGETLTISETSGGKWQLTDAKGGTSLITIADVPQSNGIIHVIDTVVMPSKSTSSVY